MPHVTLFDSHCHYNLEPLYEHWREHWQAAQHAGVIGAVVVGTDSTTSERAVKIAAHEPTLVAAVGIHPTEAGSSEQMASATQLSEHVRQWKTIGPIGAIGETGLDYFRLTADAEQTEIIKERQREAFRAHLEVAAELTLPILVHVRDQAEAAYTDVLALIKPFADNIPIVLHCFSGPAWYLDKALTLGCYISFAGNITYPSAGQLRDHLHRVPADRLLIETDAPFLPPQSHRGEVCAPAYIAETARFLQQECAVDPAQLLYNAQQIFTTMRTHEY